MQLLTGQAQISLSRTLVTSSRWSCKSRWKREYKHAKKREMISEGGTRIVHHMDTRVAGRKSRAEMEDDASRKRKRGWVAAIVSREEGQFGRRRQEGKTGRGVYVCEVSQKGWILGVGDHAGALIARRLFPPL